jgi:hypothetical protein
MLVQCFWDLESTLITPVVNGWYNTELINAEKVAALKRELKPDANHIFSFALHNEYEKRGFDAGVRLLVEQRVGELGLVPLVDRDIIPICCKQRNIHPDTVDFNELCAFWGKAQAFRLFVQHRFANPHRDHVHVVLIDDDVPNETWEWPDQNMSGRLINIDSYQVPV